jgi:hypothetical protein
MSEVAKMLGVEIGERFRLYDDDREYDADYYFLEDGIYVDIPNKNHRANSGLLFDIVSGEYSIKRKPWKPEVGECYHFIDESGLTVWYTWAHSYEDVLLYKLGDCYQTREKADKDAAKWLAFYKSDDVLEI